MLWALLLGAVGTAVGSMIAWPRARSLPPSHRITLPALGMVVVASGFAIWKGKVPKGGSDGCLSALSVASVASVVSPISAGCSCSRSGRLRPVADSIRSELTTYLDLFLPTLRAVETLGGTAQAGEVTSQVLADIGASDEQVAHTYNNRPKSVLIDRIDWARSYGSCRRERRARTGTATHGFIGHVRLAG